ncbi:MAG TPA: cytochrome b/b6 domain-containing protein [Methylomirabilota bacterium]|nr:cytochrome b/b6 domain-containing protein [Methylomirabilota bacterium]
MTRVVRFSVTERALHWAFALTYLSVLGSGLPLMFEGLRNWIRGYSPVIGLRLHVACGVLWIAATLGVVVAGDRRRLRATLRELTRFARVDALWLRRFPRWLVAGAAERARIDAGVGRFNAGQKVNLVFTLVTSGLLVVSGFTLTPLGDTVMATHVTGAASVAVWRAAHRWLTLLVLLPIAGHVYLAVIHPPTRAALDGMLDGRVDERWSAEHHPRWRPDDGEAA